MSSIDSYIDEVVLTDEDGMPTGSDLPILAETHSASRPSSIDAPGLIAGVLVDSSTSTPYIEEGVIHLPASGGSADVTLAQFNTIGMTDTPGIIAGVEFSEEVAACRIENGMMRLPMAEYMPTAGSTSVDGCAGGIVGICYVSSIDAPRISGGMIELVEPTIEQYSATVPEDGVDGWVLSAYMPMIMVSDGSGDLLVSFKQLMRIHNGKLQVNFQRAVAPTGAWENYFNS